MRWASRASIRWCSGSRTSPSLTRHWRRSGAGRSLPNNMPPSKRWACVERKRAARQGDPLQIGGVADSSALGEADRSHAAIAEAKLVGCGLAQVDDALAVERSAIIDPYLDLLAGILVGH